MLRWASILVAFGLLAPLASARVSAVPRPALGDWEGVGPHGLPLSFVLAKLHRKVVLSNLVVGLPLNCPAKPTPWVAAPFKPAEYGGPGAQPRIRLPGWKPRDVEITSFTGRFPLILGGRLLTRRHMSLSTGIGSRVPKHCGWPKKTIVWSVRPAKRVAVQTGTWTGSATVSDGTGTLTAKVIAAGRVVDLFKVELTCTAGGGGSFQSGPPAGEFISAGGAFEGWAYSNHWQARFGAAGALTGTLEASDPCGTGGQVSGTFTAQRSGP
ncbi:MAG TPA: hypothetical protein VI142_06540 [Gaiellaceae bacterium]